MAETENTQGNIQLSPPQKKKRGTAKKVFKVTGFVLLILIIAALLVNSLLSIFMDHYYPTFGEYRLFSVVTDSMEPDIPTGSMIVATKPNSEDEITVGTVITFEVTDANGNIALLTHRVTKIVPHPTNGNVSYTTKGDNAPAEDSIHPEFADVVGIYHGQKCGVFGYIFGFLQSTSGAIFILILIAAIFLIWGFAQCFNNAVKRDKRIELENAALKKSSQALSNVNLRYDNIREITAVMDVLDMVTDDTRDTREQKNIEQRLSAFIDAETIELPQTPETAAILDSLPAPDTPLSLASALRSGATLRQAEDGQTLILTGISGGKSILLTPIQTPDGIILCQQGVRLRTNIAPNIEDVGSMSMPEYPEFFEGQPLQKNVDYPELPQPKEKSLGTEQLLAPSNRVQSDSTGEAAAALSAPTPVAGQARIASSVADEHIKELAGGRSVAAQASAPSTARTSQPEQTDPEGYRAKVAYAQYRELAAQLELRQVEQLSTLLDEVKPLSEEEQKLIDRLNAEEKAAKKANKTPRKQKTPEEKAAAKARAEKRKADQEAFINALSPADRELYLSEQKLSKSRAATIRRLKKIERDRKKLEKFK